MKAVIFSCSLKDGNFSTTKAWANLQAERLIKNGVESHVVNIKDYDYEASTDEDRLHTQMSKIYDADLIIFASPTNITDMTFSCKNLLDRFVTANKRAKAQGIELFEGKVWEYASMFGCSFYTTPKGKRPVPYYDPNDISPHWKRHHGVAMDTLKFMEHLGVKTLGISTWSPADPEGPRHNDMHQHMEVVEMCDLVVDEFKKKKTKHSVPSCSLEQFMKFFESDSEHTFGRGMTLAEENVNQETVREHIKFIKECDAIVNHKANVLMCMKERCTKLRLYDLAEMYYVEHYEIMKHPEYRRGASSNYRPNGY